MSKNIQLAILWQVIIAVSFGVPSIHLKNVWLSFIAGAASVLTYFLVLVLTGEIKEKGDSND